MLSPDHDQIVVFRSANYFVTPEYTSYSGRTYYTKTGEEITNQTKKPRKNWTRSGKLLTFNWRLAIASRPVTSFASSRAMILEKSIQKIILHQFLSRHWRRLKRKEVTNQPAFITNVAISPPSISSRHQLIKNCTQKTIVLPQQRPVAVLLIMTTVKPGGLYQL